MLCKQKNACTRTDTIRRKWRFHPSIEPERGNKPQTALFYLTSKKGVRRGALSSVVVLDLARPGMRLASFDALGWGPGPVVFTLLRSFLVLFGM